MRWIAIFEDTPAMLDVGRDREQQHLDYLRQHRGEIAIAGGLREAQGGEFVVGGLSIFDVSSKERAAELVENDPYFVQPHRNADCSLGEKLLRSRESSFSVIRAVLTRAATYA